MTQEIEIEYKNLLTKDEYNRLWSHLSIPKKSKTQTNFYFETEDFSLKKHGCALRIREKAGNYTLTLKEPHETGLLETHDSLTKQEATLWISGNKMEKPNIAKRLENININISDLCYYGSLTTERVEIQSDDVLIVLDYSMYNGKSDYELEVEAPTEEIGLNVFHSLLEDMNIPKRNTPNKIQRFFDR
ncbi:CYTH domain-containing protein [Virgibacillus byunsanensis]|uniref:CYTH domain-containing protein n=1 Tax=Virgibacillus byunsanensis TaxID=570945 RepID=A0ABW3LTC2_9BACI